MWGCGWRLQAGTDREPPPLTSMRNAARGSAGQGPGGAPKTVCLDVVRLQRFEAVEVHGRIGRGVSASREDEHAIADLEIAGPVVVRIVIEEVGGIGGRVGPD